MKMVLKQSIVDEDLLVAELHQLGITNLSNRTVAPFQNRRSLERLSADAICQPSSRVRTAVIALLLLHPGDAILIQTTLGLLLNERQRLLFKLFYTAAVHLQHLYERELHTILTSDWVWLPELFGEELDISAPLTPEDAIRQLGVRPQELTPLIVELGRNIQECGSSFDPLYARRTSMEPVTPETLIEFLTRLAESYANPTSLYLLGGSALWLFGNPRQTLDIDYTTDLSSQEQQAQETIMNNLAIQYRLDIEAVPIEEFVPLPAGAETRRRFVGRFSQIDVYLYDLYTIALSIIALGFDSDLEDVIFLWRSNLIDLSELLGYLLLVLPRAPQVDIIPSEFQQHFQDLFHRLFDHSNKWMASSLIYCHWVC